MQINLFSTVMLQQFAHPTSLYLVCLCVIESWRLFMTLQLWDSVGCSHKDLRTHMSHMKVWPLRCFGWRIKTSVDQIVEEKCITDASSRSCGSFPMIQTWVTAQTRGEDDNDTVRLEAAVSVVAAWSCLCFSSRTSLPMVHCGSRASAQRFIWLYALSGSPLWN